MITISADDLINMNDKADIYNFHVDLTYAKEDNLLFGERIYDENAQLWLHRELADIVCRAAQMCFEEHNLHFVLYDGLRTIEAQEAMMHTQRVKDNPQWLEPPRLLTPPGYGGHPRGMAVDIGVVTPDGQVIDMGCPFDYLANNPNVEHNPAHRDYPHTPEVTANRKILDDCMINAAQELGTPLNLLTEEWWDFRLPREYYNQFAPISKTILPKNTP